MNTKLFKLVLSLILTLLLVSCGGDDETTTAFEVDASISVANAKVTEAQMTVFTVSISKSNTTGNIIPLSYNVSGTASQGTDYASLSGVVEIAENASSAKIEVAIIDDTSLEEDETIILTLTDPGVGGVTIATATAEVVIEDNDQRIVTVNSTDNTAKEGDNNASFTIGINKALDVDISIPYSIGGSATNGTDYESISGTANISKGAVSTTVNITVLDDQNIEGSETVIIGLIQASMPTGIILAQSTQATITIEDNDAMQSFEAVASIEATDATGLEGNNDASFTVSLDVANSTGSALEIPYIISGTATNGSDYVSLSGSASIANGETSVTILIQVIDDSDDENTETVILTIDEANLPTGITTVNKEATARIEDNDEPAATYSVTVVGPPTATEADGMTNFKVTLSATNAGSAITINYTISGTATAGVDYTAPSGSVTINTGEIEKVVDIPIIDDSEVESDETIIITLSSTGLPSDVSLGSPDTKTITITDNETDATCPNDNSTDQDNRSCTLGPDTNTYDDTTVNGGGDREIVTNGIPTHEYGNQIPMTVSNLDNSTKTYYVDNTPTKAGAITSITFDDGTPKWKFGVAKNGVAIDPAPAEPFIFENTNTGEYNWDWVMEPNNNMNDVGLDCAIAHVQPDGLYHYHGDFALFAEQLSSGISTGTAPTDPVQVGWAADGFPILYYYGPNAGGSAMVKLTSSYQLKSGQRPGDGVSEPCGEYNGKYTNDYEYVSGAGDLDECNGIERNVTLSTGTYSYFYVITAEFPVISRCLVGTPNDAFKIGP